jgi:hypothetical protein
MAWIRYEMGANIQIFTGYAVLKFDRVNVKTMACGESSITYVTDTGREIPASQVGPLLYTKLEGSGVK